MGSETGAERASIFNAVYSTAMESQFDNGLSDNAWSGWSCGHAEVKGITMQLIMPPEQTIQTLHGDRAVGPPRPQSTNERPRGINAQVRAVDVVGIVYGNRNHRTPASSQRYEPL